MAWLARQAWKYFLEFLFGTAITVLLLYFRPIKKLAIKLVDNAMMGAIDDRIASRFGVTVPAVLDFVWSWCVPPALVIIAFLAYHLFKSGEWNQRTGRQKLIGLALATIGGLLLLVGVGLLTNAGSQASADNKNVMTGRTEKEAAPAPVKVRTNPYDIPRKLKAIDDDILPLLQKDMPAIVRRGLQLQSNWRNFVVADRAKYMEQLREYRAEWQALCQKIADRQHENQKYEDIGPLLTQDYQGQYTGSFSRFQGAIGSVGDPPYTMDLDFFIKPISEAFNEGILVMDSWSGRISARLAQLRKEIAAEGA